MGPEAVPTIRSAVLNSKLIEVGNPGGIGGQLSSEFGGLEQFLQALDIGPKRDGGCLRAPEDRLLGLVAAGRLAEKAVEADVADHLQPMDEDVEKLGHRLVVAAVERVVGAGRCPLPGNAVGRLPGIQHRFRHALDVLRDRQTVSATVWVTRFGQAL